MCKLSDEENEIEFFLIYFNQVEHTKHILQVKNRLENPLSSPNDSSPDKVKYSINHILPSKSIDDRQQDLLRRCLSMMSPPPPIISRLAVPDIEVKHFFYLENKSFILY